MRRTESAAAHAARRVAAGAMALVLVVGMSPGVAFAAQGAGQAKAGGVMLQEVAEGSVASVTHQSVETGYASIADALAATQAGDTVKLLQDVASGQKINQGFAFTLDLNGHNISATKASAMATAVAVDVSNGSALTIQDSSTSNESKLGTIAAVYNNNSNMQPSAAIKIAAGCTVNLKSGIAISKSERYSTIGNAATIVLSDSTSKLVVGEAGAADSPAFVYGGVAVGAIKGGDIVINSGTVQSACGTGVATITECKSLTMKGGLVEATGSKEEADYYYSAIANPTSAGTPIKISGGTIRSASRACLWTESTVTVDGGYFEPADGEPVFKSSNGSDIAIALNGGNFKSVPTQGVEDNVTFKEADWSVGYADGWYTVGAFPGPSITTSAMPDAFPNEMVNFKFESYPAAASYELTVNGNVVTNEVFPGAYWGAEQGGIVGNLNDNSVGTYELSVVAIDAEGHKGNPKTFTWTIAPKTAPTITTENLPMAVVGNEYNTQLEATGNPARFTYALAEGSALPSGLVLSEDGVISGKPIESGAFSFTVAATNAVNGAVVGTGSKELALTVGIAKAGDEAFATLQGAIDAAEGKTVKLFTGTDENLVIDGTVTIDLGAAANEVVAASAEKPVVTVSEGAQLTLSGGALYGGRNGIEIAEGGKLSINGTGIAGFAEGGAAVALSATCGQVLDGVLAISGAALADGSVLPAGLAFEGGVLSGAPSQTGDFDVTIGTYKVRISIAADTSDLDAAKAALTAYEAAKAEADAAKQPADEAKRAADAATDPAAKAELAAAAAQAAAAAAEKAAAADEAADAAVAAAQKAGETAAAKGVPADEVASVASAANAAKGAAYAAKQDADQAKAVADAAAKAAQEEKEAVDKEAARVDISRASIKVAPATYTGKAQKPKVTVTVGGKQLVAGTDYVVSYSNNVKASKKAKVSVEGKGTYKGKASAAFAIAKASKKALGKAVKVKAVKKSVKASKLKKAARKVAGAVKVTKKAAAKAGTTVKYAKVKKGTSKRLAKINKKTGKITVKKGTAKGTYKMKVKVTVKNPNYKKAYTKTVTVKVKVK